MELLDFEKPPTPPLPVEIARLVYTFLGSTKCFATRDEYQREHPELQELQKLVERNILRDIEFKFHGRDLELILKEYILMLHGINKIAVKFLPAGESLAKVGPIIKLKKISEELTKLQSSNKNLSSPTVKNFRVRRRRVETASHVENCLGPDQITRKYRLNEPLVQQVICLSTPSQAASVAGGNEEDSFKGGVIPDLLKLQPIPQSELNLPQSDNYDQFSSFEQEPLSSSSDNTWKNKKAISNQQKSSSDAPEKSRRNAFKANPPKKKNSLPELDIDGENHVKKKLQKLSQGSNEELLSQLVAEPLVNILSTTQSIDETVENFMSNQEYLDSLNNLLSDLYDAPETETITLHRSTEETRRRHKSEKLKVSRDPMITSSSRFTANFRRSFEAVRHTDANEIEIGDHVKNFDEKSTLNLVAELSSVDVQPSRHKPPFKMGTQLMQDTSSNKTLFRQDLGSVQKTLPTTPTKQNSRNATPVKVNSGTINLSTDARPTAINEKSDVLRFILKSPDKQGVSQNSVSGFENILTLQTVTYASPVKLRTTAGIPDQPIFILESNPICPRGEKRVFSPDAPTEGSSKIPRLEIQNDRTPQKVNKFQEDLSAKTPNEACLRTPTKSRHFPNILRPKLTPRKAAFEASIFRTPVKPSNSDLLSTPQKIDLECSETLECNTPPGEQYHFKARQSRNKSPSKTPGPDTETQAESTPLKALREAVRLATPSPIKYLFTPRKSLVTKGHNIEFSPALSESSVKQLPPRHFQTLFTPSPSSRGTISPATSKKQTPLKGLAEALSKISESGTKPQRKQGSPSKTSVDVAKKLFTEDNPVLGSHGEQGSSGRHSEYRHQGFANWSSPDALRAHSTPRTFTKPPADHSLVVPVSPTNIKPQSSRCVNDSSGLPDFPLDLTLKSTSSDNVTQQNVEVPAGSTHEKCEPDNLETPNKSRNSRSAVKVDTILDTQLTKTLKAGNPNTSAGLPSFRGSKKSYEKGKTSRIEHGTKRNSAKKRGQESKKKTNKVASVPRELTNLHGLTLDKLSIYFSQPPK